MSPVGPARPSAEELERLFFDLSSRFIRLSPGEVDGEIEAALRRVCELLRIDFAVLWQWSVEAPDVIVPTHSSFAQDGPRPAEPMSQEQYPWTRQQVLGGHLVVVSDLQDLPAEARIDRESCRLYGVQSALCLPLVLGGEPPVGALGLNCVQEQRDWPDELVKWLQLVSQIFTHALARQRHELMLMESEEVSRATFDQAAVGLAYVGADGRWLQVNDRLCKIVGYSRAELLQLTFQEITHPDDLDADLDRVRQVLSGEVQNYSMEKRYVRKDRSLVWINLTVSLLRTAAGVPRHFIAVVEEITGRKQAEEDRRDLSRRLIHAHEEERAMLARELHDDLTQRLAVLAIDVGRLELAAPAGAQVEEIQSIREGLVHLSEDVHSLATHLHPSVLEELGLEEALRAEAERVGRRAPIDLSLEILPVPTAVAREVALCLFRVAQEALNNLVRHAGARTASLALRPFDGGLILAVADNGVGFDPATPATRSSLGLASMRERVWLVNGTLDIESAPGRGTTVLAWVPVAGEAR